jgi:hypothetical protein
MKHTHTSHPAIVKRPERAHGRHNKDRKESLAFRMKAPTGHHHKVTFRHS